MKFHSLNSFIKKGFQEYTTWIGIALLFGWIFYNEIDQLIKNILTSPAFLAIIIHGIATLVGFIFIIWKQKQEKPKDNKDDDSKREK